MPWISLSPGIEIRCLEITVTWILLLSGYLHTRIQNENKRLLSQNNQQNHLYHFPLLEIVICIYTLKILLFVMLCCTKHSVPRLKIKKYNIILLQSSLFDWMFLMLMYVSMTSEKMDVPLFLTSFWISYYYYIKEEILFLITFLWNQLIDFLCRYAFWRVLSYVCSVILNACVFVYIIISVLTYAHTEIYNAFSEQNFITFIDDLPTYILQNNTVPVPFNKPLLETNYELTFYAIDKYSIHDRKAVFSPYMRSKGTLMINNGTKYLPLIREKISRREGSDVLFSCAYSLQGSRYESNSESLLRDVDVFWRKNGVKIMESNLLRVSKTIHIHSDSVVVISVLKMYVIQENDFGRYDCVESIRKHEYSSTVFTSNLVMCSFFLEKIKPKQYKYYVPLGNFLFLNWGDFHFDEEVGNENNILYYTVNKMGISSLIEMEPHPHCTTQVILYKSIFEFIRGIKLPGANVKKETTHSMLNVMPNKYRPILTICAFPGIYGVHRNTVYREILNKETNKSELHAVNHSDEIIILPDTPYFRERNNSSYSSLNEDLEKHAFMTSSYISRNDKIVWWIRVIGELLLFLLCVLVFIYITATICSIYNALYLIPIRKFILEGHLRPKPVCLRDCQYHLCVLSSEDDTNSVVTDIVEPIENNSDIKVCCFNRDTCHLGGGSIFKCYSEVFNESKKVLLYLTRAFIHDPECMRLQFETTMSRIVNGDLMPKDVVLVLREHCELPDEYKNMLQNVAIQDWTQVTSNEERISSLRRWILATEMQVDQVNTSVYTILI